jgi:GNAT superfamily N-acetyltransferase
MEVRRLRADEWPQWRDLRLAMLSDAPYAFGSTYAEASTFTDDDWRARATRLATAEDNVLYVAGDWLGCAGGYVDEDSGFLNVFGVFTRPQARGQRVAERCVTAVLDWARGRGETEVRLWATDGNDPATRLYARLGFTPTGAVQPLPSDESRTESEYSLTL